jgi:hypothetical protein
MTRYKALSLDAAVSLVNSRVAEQRDRGIGVLQAGEFSQPDNIKVWKGHAVCCAPAAS